jgi:hypothetical protein
MLGAGVLAGSDVRSAVRVLVASADLVFAEGFCETFGAYGVFAAHALEGFEALTMLESSRYSILLYDDGYSESTESGLTGIRGDELSHMWRQIERRGEHMVIVCVSRRDDSESTLVKSRFAINPADHARNRGVDYHFWDDCSNKDIVVSLLEDINVRRQQVREAVVCDDRETVLPMLP